MELLGDLTYNEAKKLGWGELHSAMQCLMNAGCTPENKAFIKKEVSHLLANSEAPEPEQDEPEQDEPEQDRWVYHLPFGACGFADECNSCSIICPNNEDLQLQVDRSVCPPTRCRAFGWECADCQIECPLNHDQELRGEDTRSEWLTHEYRFYLSTPTKEEYVGKLYPSRWSFRYLYRKASAALHTLDVTGEPISIEIRKSPVGLDGAEIEDQILVGKSHLRSSSHWWRPGYVYRNFWYSLSVLITRNFPKLVGESWLEQER